MLKNSSRTMLVATAAAIASSSVISPAAQAQPLKTQHVTTQAARTQAAVTSTTVPPAVKFSPRSWMYRDIRRAPVAKNSRAMVANLEQQIYGRWNGVASVNAYQYNASFYRANRNTPRQTVQFYDCQGKGYTPSGLFDGRKQFVNVPIPRGAVPATGTDGNLTIHDPVTDKLWEFWVAERVAGTQQWKACWGGRIDNVSRSMGTFGGHYGATATGISFAGTMVSVEEAKRRQINHVMYMAIPEPKVHTDFSWPALRSDGFSTAPGAIPEGTILRLDPKVNVNALKLTPFAKAVARAAQKHGFIVADKAGSVNISTESGAAEKARTGKDPWQDVFGSTPDYEQLRGFPWSRLQAVAKDYGKGR